MIGLTVMIPTFRRPEGLDQAVRSVFAQIGIDWATTELVIVDNSPEAGARAQVEAHAATAPLTVRYVHAAEPGVANARNAGFAAARGAKIAMLDDDEAATPGWLAALCDTAQRFDAAVVFGPVIGRSPAGCALPSSYVAQFFSRPGPTSSGPIDDYYGCGNALIDRGRVTLPDPPFDRALDQLGGEDDRLFSRLHRSGVRFAWAHEGEVYEDVPAARATLRHVLARSFARGQGPSQICVGAQPRQTVKLAFWMMVGLGQLGVYGAGAGLMWYLNRARALGLLARAAEGLGKCFWMDAFAPKLYAPSPSP